MKVSTAVLSVSVACNVALLGALWTGRAESARPTPSSAQRAERTRVTADARRRNAWALLATPDLAQQRDKLRAEGFPDDIVRAIIAAQIADRDEPQRRALLPETDAPFWKTTSADPKARAAMRELRRRERLEVDALLGRDPDDTSVTQLADRMPQLSAEKRDRVSEIAERFEDQRNALYGQSAGRVVFDEVRAAEKARDAELAAVLTPAEFEEYKLRMGDVARQLVYQLGSFDPTEEEFRTVVKIKEAYAERTAYRPNSSPAEMQARTAADQQMEEQLAMALGPDRYADYQRATDISFHQTSNLIDRLGLPKETAIDLYNLQKEYQQRRQDLIHNPGNPPTNMIEQSRALQAEATEKATALLGGDPKLTALYYQYGGSWLKYLAPQMQPRAPANR